MRAIQAIESNGIIAPAEPIPENAKAVRLTGDTYQVAETDEEAQTLTPVYTIYPLDKDSIMKNEDFIS